MKKDKDMLTPQISFWSLINTNCGEILEKDSDVIPKKEKKN